MKMKSLPATRLRQKCNRYVASTKKLAPERWGSCCGDFLRPLSGNMGWLPRHRVTCEWGGVIQPRPQRW